MVTGSRVLLATAVLGTLSPWWAACSAPDPALVADLEELDTPLFLPDLRGQGLTDLYVDGGRAVADVAGSPGTSFSQAVAAVDFDGAERSLCEAFDHTYEDGSDCRDDGEYAWIADFEEMTTVGLLRSGTVLVLHGLVTEADRTLTDDALASLREAPEVTAEELAEAVPAFEGG